MPHAGCRMWLGLWLPLASLDGWAICGWFAAGDVQRGLSGWLHVALTALDPTKQSTLMPGVLVLSCTTEAPLSNLGRARGRHEKRPPAGCCYESNCGLPPNPDGRDTPGFQPEETAPDPLGRVSWIS